MEDLIGEKSAGQTIHEWVVNDRRENPDNYPSFKSIEEWVRREFKYPKSLAYMSTVPRGRKGLRVFVCKCVAPYGKALLVYHRDDSLHWLLNNYKGEMTMPDGTIRLTGNCPECDAHCEFRLIDNFWMEWSDNVRESAAHIKALEDNLQHGKTLVDVEREEQEMLEAEQSDPRLILLLTGFESSRRRELAYGIGTNRLGEIVKFKPPGGLLHDLHTDYELCPRPQEPEQKPAFGSHRRFYSHRQRELVIDPQWVVTITRVPQDQPSPEQNS